MSDSSTSIEVSYEVLSRFKCYHQFFGATWPHNFQAQMRDCMCLQFRHSVRTRTRTHTLAHTHASIHTHTLTRVGKKLCLLSYIFYVSFPMWDVIFAWKRQILGYCMFIGYNIMFLTRYLLFSGELHWFYLKLSLLHSQNPSLAYRFTL